MEIGIGLPSHATWSDGRSLVEWARRAEERGFASISVSDRLLWSTPDPLIMLAAAAGATSRIRLLTSVLLAPLHANHQLFAKATATLDHAAGPGRVELGLAAGAREEDFTVSGVDFRTRGKQFDELLDRLAEVWQDGARGGLRPATPGGPAVLIGGHSPAALRRMATHGAGWVAGTATTEEIAQFLPKLWRVWSEAGRADRPRVVASVMYALGPDADRAVTDAIAPYYAFAGEEYVRHGIATAVTTPDQITAAVAAYEAVGCDELHFTGNDPDPAQVDLLADVLGM